MKYAPIALFVYNRLWHTQQTIDALKNNPLSLESELFIFSDGGKNEDDWRKVREVRAYIKGVCGFKRVSITERDSNKGLANSIIEGVTEIVNKYGRIIVIEDDLVTSPYFLNYMNDALKIYENDENVACTSGYIYPIHDLPKTFFIKGADCWGWATWRRAWSIFNANGAELLKEISEKNIGREFDFDGSYSFTQMLKDQITGKNNSWAIRWHASAFLKNKLCLYPQKSFVQNIGNDDSGTHCGYTKQFDVSLVDNYSPIERIEPIHDQVSNEKIVNFLRMIYPQNKDFHKKKNLLTQILDFLKKHFQKNKKEKNRIYNRDVENREYGFFGDYSCWEEVEKLCKGGYSKANILSKTLELTLKVKNGEVVFKRDSFIFNEIQYSWGLLASLFKAAVENNNKLRVLDFGGALGSHYFQNKDFLHPIKIEKWTVVEQKRYVDAGNEKIADGVLDFAYSINDVRDANVLIMSGVLQYLPDPYNWLEKLVDLQIPFIIMDRTAFSAENRDRLTLQKVPPEIYEALIPCWFLREEIIFSILTRKYVLAAKFKNEIDECPEIPSRFFGGMFRLK